MARLFDGTNDSLVGTATLDLSPAGTDEITISFNLYWDSFADNDDLAFEHSADSNSNEGAFLLNPNWSGGSKFQMAFHGTGSANRRTEFTRPSAATLHRYLLVVSAGDAGNNLAFVDGVSQSLNVSINNGGATWGNYTPYVMSRGNSALFAAGRMSELAIWTTGLGQAEATTLNSGFSPLFVSPQNLVLYAPLIGRTSPELELIQGNNFTVNGAVVTPHPAVIYPTQPISGFAAAAEPPAGLIIPVAMYHYRQQHQSAI